MSTPNQGWRSFASAVLPTWADAMTVTFRQGSDGERARKGSSKNGKQCSIVGAFKGAVIEDDIAFGPFEQVEGRRRLKGRGDSLDGQGAQG